MFEASSVYFQYVNEGAAHLKKDLVIQGLYPVDINLGRSKSLISLIIGCHSTSGVL